MLLIIVNSGFNLVLDIKSHRSDKYPHIRQPLAKPDNFNPSPGLVLQVAAWPSMRAEGIRTNWGLIK
jgi:hypothetical protein